MTWWIIGALVFVVVVQIVTALRNRRDIARRRAAYARLAKETAEKTTSIFRLTNERNEAEKKLWRIERQLREILEPGRHG